MVWAKVELDVSGHIWGASFASVISGSKMLKVAMLGYLMDNLNYNGGTRGIGNRKKKNGDYKALEEKHLKM